MGAFEEAIAKLKRGEISLDLSSEKIDALKATILAEVLETNTTLEKLSLCDCNINDAVLNILLKALAKHPSLRHLDLAGNMIGVLGAKMLAEMLVENDILEELWLFRNYAICDEGVEALSKGLSKNNSLKLLKLENIGMTYVGAVVVAEKLLINKSLTSLDLSDNDIGHKDDLGEQAFAKVLRTNSSLITLQLIYSGISNFGAWQLVEAWNRNHTLKNLCLEHNFNIDEQAIKALLVDKKQGLDELYLACVNQLGIEELERKINGLTIGPEYRQTNFPGSMQQSAPVEQHSSNGKTHGQAEITEEEDTEQIRKAKVDSIDIFQEKIQQNYAEDNPEDLIAEWDEGDEPTLQEGSLSSTSSSLFKSALSSDVNDNVSTESSDQANVYPDTDEAMDTAARQAGPQ